MGRSREAVFSAMRAMKRRSRQLAAGIIASRCVEPEIAVNRNRRAIMQNLHRTSQYNKWAIKCRIMSRWHHNRK